MDVIFHEKILLGNIVIKVHTLCSVVDFTEELSFFTDGGGFFEEEVQFRAEVFVCRRESILRSAKIIAVHSAP